jgi:hypothetical protein
LDAWRIGAAEYARGRQRDQAVLESAVASLADARTYVERDILLPRQEPAEETYAAVLRDLAAEVPDGPLTCTTYTRVRERHPEWPNRNTVTTAFGGWAQALRAAGLESRMSARSAHRTD